MKIVPINVGHLIKQTRTVKGWSQSDVSAAIGFSCKNGQFISNIERGLCSLPAKKIIKICDVLGMSGEDLKTAMVRDYELAVNTVMVNQIGEMQK